MARIQTYPVATTNENKRLLCYDTTLPNNTATQILPVELLLQGGGGNYASPIDLYDGSSGYDVYLDYPLDNKVSGIYLITLDGPVVPSTIVFFVNNEKYPNFYRYERILHYQSGNPVTEIRDGVIHLRVIYAEEEISAALSDEGFGAIGITKVSFIKYIGE